MMASSSPLHRLRSNAVPLVALLLLACAGFLGACQAEEPNTGVTIDDIVDNPQDYVGQTVTVSGEIGRVYGPNAFTLGSDAALGEGILVIIPSTANVTGLRTDGTLYYEEDVIQVTGTVREQSIAEVEQELGLDFDPQLDVDYEGTQPMIVAETGALTPGPGQPMGPMDTTMMDTTMTDTTMMDTTMVDTTGGF